MVKSISLRLTYLLAFLYVIITVATFVYIDRFDFAARPLGLVYLGAYVLVALVTAFYLVRYGTGAERRAALAGSSAGSGRG